MKLREDKTRFINNLPWKTAEEKQKVLDFFKSHANLESKIQNWQSRDKENLVNEIRNLISEVEKASLEKEKVKQGYRGNINWESHDCKYLGEDEDWIYVTPLSYEGAVFCDSSECGGAGAKWCIGYEKSDKYWKYYRRINTLFLMKFNKHPKNKQEDLKFMISGHLDESEVKIWDQTDKSQNYLLSSQEEYCLQKVENYWLEEKKQKIALYFDNPEPGVYIAKNEESLKHIEDIQKDLKVFKVREGVIFKNEDARHMFEDCTRLVSIDTSAFKNVTDASWMFKGCTSLTSIDTSGFVNVKDSGAMFQNCTSLASIDTSVFKNAKNVGSMFWGCTSLTSIDTSAFVNVWNTTWMFYGCKSLASVDTSAFKNVESALGMFQDCTSLTSIDASTFVNVRWNESSMFDGCTSLKAYIPGPNRDVNRTLEKIGAKPVKRLGESFRRRVIEEILEE